MELGFSLRAVTVLILSALCAWPAVSAADALPPDSLYQLEAKWKTAEGKEISLSEYRGHPVVITMAYTKCTYTCPMIVAKLKKIEAALKKNPRLRLVLISFDSKRETPDSMRKFMKEKDLDPSRWMMLTGTTPQAVREIAALLEINYKEEANGEYSHSNVIALLDKKGVKRASVVGIAADHDPLVKAAKKEL